MKAVLALCVAAWGCTPALAQSADTPLQELYAAAQLLDYAVQCGIVPSGYANMAFGGHIAAGAMQGIIPDPAQIKAYGEAGIAQGKAPNGCVWWSENPQIEQVIASYVQTGLQMNQTP